MSDMTRRGALAAAMGSALATQWATSGSAGASLLTRGPVTRPPGVGQGGVAMPLREVSAAAKRMGFGQPVALVDLAAVDHNCRMLLNWSRAHNVAWRPAFKTLRSPELLAYVMSKLDQPRVMIHHLRDLSQGMEVLPAGTDWLMGYPPTLGELNQYLKAGRARGQRPYTLHINVDSLPLLRALETMTKHTSRSLPVNIVLEIFNGIPRGGINLGAELDEALRILRHAQRRIKLTALLCYDALAAGISTDSVRVKAAKYAQSQFAGAQKQIASQAGDFVNVHRLIRNGPGSANYTNWASSKQATEFSAGSAVLFADYLDPYDTAKGFQKALYLCAPVLRLPDNNTVPPLGITLTPPAGSELVFIKAGGWPTGNGAVLSTLRYPSGLGEEPIYGRGANSSGMISAPKGSLALGDYVIETPHQVMEGQDYFGALYAVREGRMRARWSTLSRWGGVREEASLSAS